MTYRFEEQCRARFGELVGNGPERMAFCKFHDNTSTPALQVNVELGVYLCFSCGAKGSIRKKTTGSEEDLRGLMQLLERANRPELPVERPAHLPESALDRYRDAPKDYWYRRGFDIATVRLFQLGFSVLENAAVIPVRDRYGNLLGFIKRSLNESSGAKYRNPTGFDRKHRLFGEWLVPEGHRTAVLVEGPVDAMRVWQSGNIGLATYGTSVNESQIDLLSRLGIEDIVLFMDDDDAGWKATDLIRGWARDRFSVRHVRRSLKGVRSDPGAMEPAALDLAIACARLVV